MSEKAGAIMPERDSETQTQWTGGCQCGNVRYVLSARPDAVTICHCRMCQKASGGPYMAFTRAATETVAWTRGSPAVFKSSNKAARGFCTDCGTPMTYQYRLDAISFTLCSLDDPTRLVPDRRLGLEAVLPWCERLTDLPAERTDAWPTADGRAAFVNHQQPDQDA